MLPEAVELGGARTLPAVLLGFLALYLLERFVLIHICGEPGMNQALSTATVHHPHQHPGHVHGDEAGCEVHTLGLAAWVGMSIHTMVDGFALGAANHEAGPTRSPPPSPSRPSCAPRATGAARPSP
jgi:zinc and cadmium transporter